MGWVRRRLAMAAVKFEKPRGGITTDLGMEEP
jgi:hypothetical protein